MSSSSKLWIRRYQKGRHHVIPSTNFHALDRAGKTLFDSLIQGQRIDLYVYNADTADLVFGRANLEGGYSRDLAHHIGLVEDYIGVKRGPARDKFSQGSMDIAVDHQKKKVYFKYLTMGLEDKVFPVELEWMTHIGSLQDMAMMALKDIGMPASYEKVVVKAARIY